jgi:hypothetical protein
MSKKPQSFIKKKAGKNAAGPGFRTSDHFKGRVFGKNFGKVLKFNPSQFRTQHKG